MRASFLEDLQKRVFLIAGFDVDVTTYAHRQEIRLNRIQDVRWACSESDCCNAIRACIDLGRRNLSASPDYDVQWNSGCGRAIVEDLETNLDRRAVRN